ncbi:undecaprenyl-phosphate glucose phosphotransferase [Pseudomonas huanghezhanensis]|uniref:undecaprenyl-phosphate glucose phosphotransferase n=1 Tax=Pseudomonas huanghezhanensis TaxID=3002903 RepID=UPI00228692B8|nr:undecaprenyl-phosphate glucose phosphotransferase [Pseudomonas sp. BSw22131]
MDTDIRQPLDELAAFQRTPTVLQNYANYILYFADILAMMLTSLVVYFGAQYYVDDGPAAYFRYGMAVVIAVVTFSIFGFSSGQYEWQRFKQQVRAPFITFGGMVFAFGALLLIGFMFKITESFSRLWITSWFAGFSLYILISRLMLVWYFSRPSQATRGSIFRRRALILGAGEVGQQVVEHMRRFNDQNIDLVGCLDDRGTRLPPSDNGVPLLGNTDLADEMVRQHGIDLIIVAMPWQASARIEMFVRKFSSWSVDVYLAPDKLGFLYADRPVLRVGGAYFLSLQARPISEWNAVVKRVKDVVVSLAAIAIFSPVLALVALAIKLESKGPVLFIQERFGFNNETIRVFKFRSMFTDRGDQRGAQQTVAGDPRVTRVGRFIRKTSIDELPQLFNVLLGNMSLVGPRPHATGMHSGGELLHDLLSDYASRHRVKPGVTGWAQCNGWRGETDTQEKLDKRIEHDLFYIENWSVSLDIIIIIKTALMLVRRDKNAY